jgi:hypothetical protein
MTALAQDGVSQDASGGVVLTESPDLLATIISKREEQARQRETQAGLSARHNMSVSERRAAIQEHWAPVWSRLERAIGEWETALRPTGCSISVQTRGYMELDTAIIKYEISVTDIHKPSGANKPLQVILSNRSTDQVTWWIPKAGTMNGEQGEVSIFGNDPFPVLWDKISGFIQLAAT